MSNGLAKMELTIVTVVRNDAARLRKTADSILPGIDANVEWIIVDGASTDSTSEILRSLAGRARIISEPDGGLYDAMNKGVQAARGRYIWFLNAGDTLVETSSVSTVLRTIKETAEIDLLLGDAEIDFGKELPFYMRARECERWIWHSLPTSHQAIIIKRELHLAVPHDLAYSVSSDYYSIAKMWMGGATSHRIGCAIVRIDKDFQSVSFRNPGRHFKQCMRVQREVLKLPASQILISLMRRVFIKIYWWLTRWRWTHGLLKIAARRA